MKQFSTTLLILLITISTFAILSPHVKGQSAYLDEFAQLTTNPMKDRYPICSPDGSTISYYAFDSSAWYRHLWSMHPDGSGKTQLTFGNVIDQTCDYSPDGSKIIFMKHRGGTTFDLMILHLDTSTTETFLARGESLHDARWSNNGDRITFILMKHGAGIYEIHMMDIDGTNEVTLVSGTHHPLTHYWSPDDTKIVYSSSDGFWIVNTSPPYDKARIYETSQEAIHCAYSPDGNYILFTTRPLGGDYQDLYLMDKDGNFIAQLTFDASIGFPMEWSPLTWSSNGEYIVFCSNRAGNEDIWRARINILGPVSLPWRDDFNYLTNAEMRAAGWNLIGEHLIGTGDGTITLTNDGVTDPGVFFEDMFPSGVYDFIAEASAKRTDSTFCGIGIDIITEKHTYSAGADGATSDYRFIRDGALLLSVPGYTPLLNTWEKIQLRRSGNTFSLYMDDTLKLSYEETDDTPSQMTGAGMHSGWLATIKYDYISVQSARIFDPRIDGFHFTNNPIYFLPEWCEQNTEDYLENIRATIESKYPDLYEVWVLQDEFVKDLLYSMIISFAKYWHGNGHCRGMTSTAKQFFLGTQILPPGVDKTFDLYPPRTSTSYDEDLQKLIDDNQNAVADPYIIARWISLALYKVPQDQEYEAVKAFVSTGTPALISLHPTNGPPIPHSALAYKVDDVDKKIHIYDPNAPGEYKCLEFEEIGGTLDMKVYDPEYPDFDLTFDMMALTEVPDDPEERARILLSLLIDLLSISVKCPIELHVFDSVGRHTGLDPNQEIVCEIPNSIYIGDFNGTRIILIDDPTPDQYDISIVALEECQYELNLCIITNMSVDVRALLFEINENDVHMFSVEASDGGLKDYSWEYVFEDAEKGTILKISTDDKYFQFITPDKMFPITQADTMWFRRGSFLICHIDDNLKLRAFGNTRYDFCIAFVKDFETGECYFLHDKPDWRC